MNDILALVLAGGMGLRLKPLTEVRAKPAVPFGAVYRIIDFTLSNCVNSRITRVYVLTQYKSHSLSKHLKTGWNLYSRRLNQYIDEIPAQMQKGNHWYKGTADAIRQSMHLVDGCGPKHVLILSGDHIYKMDYRQIRRFHEERKASLTIAIARVAAEFASNTFGVLEVDATGRVVGFEEKPARPKTIPGSGDCLVSMGIYIFTTPSLRRSLDNEFEDFGTDIIPRLIASGERVFAWDFSGENRIEEYEYRCEDGRRVKRRVAKARDSAYWRDIGSIEAYYAANLDLVAPKPSFNLNGELWPIFSAPIAYPPAKFIHASDGRTGMALDSIVSNGVTISGSTVRGSILGPGVYVHSFADIEDSVILGGSKIGGIVIDTMIGRGCRVRNAIVDKCSSLPDGIAIGFDRAVDEANGFHCVPLAGTGDHIVVVPRTWGISLDLEEEVSGGGT